MAVNWRDLPTDVLDEERRTAKTRSWIDQQRQQATAAWADAMRGEAYGLAEQYRHVLPDVVEPDPLNRLAAPQEWRGPMPPLDAGNTGEQRGVPPGPEGIPLSDVPRRVGGLVQEAGAAIAPDVEEGLASAAGLTAAELRAKYDPATPDDEKRRIEQKQESAGLDLVMSVGGPSLPSGALKIPPGSALEKLSQAIAGKPEGDLATQTRLWLQQRMGNRIQPFAELDRAAKKAWDEGVAAQAQVLPGMGAAGEDIVQREVMPIIDGLGKDAKALELYWTSHAMEDVATVKSGTLLPGGVTGAEPSIARSDLRTAIGDARYAKVEAAANQLWELNKQYRIQPLREEGMLNDAQQHALVTDYPHYLPFVREHLSSIGGGIGDIAKGLGVRTEEGGTQALRSPIGEWMRDLVATQRVVQNNRVRREMIDTMAGLEKEGVPLPTGGRDKRYVTEIAYYDPATPGTRLTAWVPQMFGDAVKAMGANVGDDASDAVRLGLGVWRAMGLPLRMGATALDVGFWPVNLARDLGSLWMREGISLADPAFRKGLAAAFTKNDTYGEAARAGGLMSGYTSSDIRAVEKRLAGWSADPANPVQRLVNIAGGAFGKVMSVPEALEKAPRLAAYIKQSEAGAGATRAAVHARDVTVDFQKGGDLARLLNVGIPFFNPTIQGTVNLGRAIGQDPKRFLAATAAPMVALSAVNQAWNSQFKSAASIPDYEYDRYWPFIAGEITRPVDAKNPQGEKETVPVLVRVPKLPGAAMIVGPFEYAVRYAAFPDQRNVKNAIAGMVRSTVESASPVSDASSVLPPAVRGMLETGTGPGGYDYFRGTDIVPGREQGLPPGEQYGAETSVPAIQAGQALGVSPRKVEHFGKAVGGGAVTNLAFVADLLEKWAGAPPPTTFGGARRSGLSGPEQASRTPVVGRFLHVPSQTEPERTQQQGYHATVDEQRKRYLQEVPELRDLGIQFTEPPPDIRNAPLTPVERTRYAEVLVPRLIDTAKMVRSLPGYEQATPQQRYNAIRAWSDRTRDQVREEMAREFNQRRATAGSR